MAISADCEPSAARASDASTVSDWTRKRAYALAGFAAVVGLGIWTRFHQLGMESLWMDESTTFYRARLPIPELIASSIGKMHIPSYFLIVHYAMRLGDDEWMLRMPSAVFGVLKIALVTIAGSIVGGRRVGVLAGLLLVLSPTQLHYDQEARMYAAQTFGTCLALVGQLWLLTRPQAAVECWSRRRAAGGTDHEVNAARCAWVAWALGVVFAMYMHNTSALYLVASSAATLVFLIVEPRFRVRFFWHWVVANLIVLLLWSAWLPSLASQMSSSEFSRFDWKGVRSFRVLLGTTARLLLGRFIPVAVLVLSLAVAGVVQLRRRPMMLAILLLLSLSAPALFWLVSLYKPIFMLRLLMWAGPAFYVLAAQGVLLLPRPWQQSLAIGVVAGVGLWGLQGDYYARENKSNWRGAAQVLSKHVDDGALVVQAASMEGRVIRYYADRTTDPIRLPTILTARSARGKPQVREALKSATDLVYIAVNTRTAHPAVFQPVLGTARLVGRVEPHNIVIEHYVLNARTEQR
jgi:mannosyltransferase